MESGKKVIVRAALLGLLALVAQVSMGCSGRSERSLRAAKSDQKPPVGFSGDQVQDQGNGTKQDERQAMPPVVLAPSKDTIPVTTKFIIGAPLERNPENNPYALHDPQDHSQAEIRALIKAGSLDEAGEAIEKFEKENPGEKNAVKELKTQLKMAQERQRALKKIDELLSDQGWSHADLTTCAWFLINISEDSNWPFYSLKKEFFIEEVFETVGPDNEGRCHWERLDPTTLSDLVKHFELWKQYGQDKFENAYTAAAGNLGKTRETLEEAHHGGEVEHSGQDEEHQNNHLVYCNTCCKICYDSNDFAKCSSCPGGATSICKDCYATNVLQKKEDSTLIKKDEENGKIIFELKCPDVKCGTKHGHKQITANLDKETGREYMNLFRQRDINEHTTKCMVTELKPDGRMGPCGCTVAINPMIQNKDGRYETNNYKCKKGHESCGKCHSKAHLESDCETAKKNAEENETTWEALKEQGVKPCPKCGIWTQRGAGCDHMQCPYCKHEYCNLCLADYKKIKANTIKHAEHCEHFHSANGDLFDFHTANQPDASELRI